MIDAAGIMIGSTLALESEQRFRSPYQRRQKGYLRLVPHSSVVAYILMTPEMRNFRNPGREHVKILVSTQNTQGQCANDFCFVPDGELLIFGPICQRDAVAPDGPCGCGRSLFGMYSLGGTTTMMVQDLSISPSHYYKEIRESVVRSGYDLKPTTLKRLYDVLTTAASRFESGHSRVQNRHFLQSLIPMQGFSPL